MHIIISYQKKPKKVTKKFYYFFLIKKIFLKCKKNKSYKKCI